LVASTVFQISFVNHNHVYMSATCRVGLFFAISLGFALRLSAQSVSSDELLRGDKQYDLYAYNIAKRTFESVLKTDATNAYAMARIGDCEMQLNKVDEALTWYKKAVEQPGVEPDVYGRYGKALMQTGDYNSARTWLEKWKTGNPTDAQRCIDMCDYAQKTINQQPLYTIKNEGLNTASSDFGPAFYGNRLVFSSSRTDIPRKKSGKSGSDWSGSAYNQLYITQINPETGSLQSPAHFQGDLQNQFNEGPVTFSDDAKKAAFCRNNFLDGTRQMAEKGLNLSLFVADVSGDNWSEAKAFPYNGTDYSMGFPALSADGNTLYFASNKPGGQGGWDIYMSHFSGGQWSYPLNLGAPLNTPGNETTPFFDGKDLYFSSDWHRGYGGLDVFRALMDGNKATDIRHLGPGINSPRDDYGFVFNPAKRVGYLTSNRLGGRGAEDIYSVTRVDNKPVAAASAATPNADMYTVAAETPATPANNADIYAVATDARSLAAASEAPAYHYVLVTDANMKPLEDVAVDMRDCNSETGVTDAEGKFYFPAAIAPKDCGVFLRKAGYQDQLLNLKTFGQAHVTATMLMDQRKDYRGLVLDEKTKKPIADAFLSMSIPETGVEVQAQTNPKGEYVLFIHPDQTYTLDLSKTGYQPIVTTIQVDATGKLKPIYLKKGNAVTAANTGSTAVAKGVTATAYNAPELAGGYAIQVGAQPNKPTSTQLKEFEPLTQYGHVYNVQDGSKYKIRLGVYSSKNKASTVLKEVKTMPKFKDAFIVEEKNANNDLLIDEVSKPIPGTSGGTGTNPKGGLYTVEIANQEMTKPVLLERYANLINLGNLYTKTENNRMSIRLGVWSVQGEAALAQEQVIKRGYPNALVMSENGVDPSYQAMQLSASSQSLSPQAIAAIKADPKAQAIAKGVKESKTTGYYVRLAALSQPDKFDTQMLNGVGGQLQKQTLTNGMTMMYLSGFASKTEAQQASDKARANGIKEASVVELRNGQLVRPAN